jgi:acyl-CoA thioesterase-1
MCAVIRSCRGLYDDGVVTEFRRRDRWVWVPLAVAMAAACGSPAVPAVSLQDGAPIEWASDPADAASVDRDRPRVVVLGDSLTAGLGLAASESYPARLQTLADEAGYDVEVVAMGVSGDTTAGGLRRLEWSLDGDVRVVVVALGGNDGLRGLPVEQMKMNLGAVIDQTRERGARVLLAGMEAPPNFGPRYADDFRAVFRELANGYTLAFVPFLLEGVAGVPGLNQADGIHPNAEGAARVAAHVWSVLEPLLAEASGT